MSTKASANTEASHAGISFASALRDVLVCGVILVDRQEKMTHISDEARQILRLGAKPQRGASIHLLPAALQHVIREVLSVGKPVGLPQVEARTEGGGAAIVRVNVVPLGAPAAEAGAVVVVNDITPAKRLEENFRHFDRLASIGTLSASMAHEIRNALVAGKTFFDLLLEKHQDAELVDVARREICRIEAIVSRMLKFVGPAEPKYKEVHLHEVLEHSLRLVQPQFEGKLITLNRSFQAAPDRVNGDELQLEQAFVNLLLNALEAMGSEGTLTVATESLTPAASLIGGTDLPAEARIGLTIQDTGPGIPPESLARLFEPFFTTKSNGTGLGLPITRRIIQEHRGDITVESAPAKGTTFRIILPALDTPS
jgi:signal transduction histidine kinase